MNLDGRNLAGALATMVAVAVAGQTYGASPRGPVNLVPLSGTVSVRADEPTAYFIELQGEPAALSFARELEQGGVPARGGKAPAPAIAAGRQQTLRNRAEQSTLARALASLGVRELYRAERVLNGIAVLARPSEVGSLRRLPGVRRVVRIEAEFPTNARSVPFIGAPAVWENSVGLPAGVLGSGVRIAVIDTGIDYMHGSFGGTGLLADYQQAATDSASWTTAPSSGPGAFPTAKVAGGWDLVGDAYNGNNVPSPDANPMDCHGHGSHVAGTAAGLGVTGAGVTYAGAYNSTEPYATAPRVGPGVAPGAELFALRVFGCGGSTRVTASAIDWAVDPNGDGDFSDRMDVINMSLGSNFGHPADLSATAADNAARVGVIVVASAGNGADTYFITGTPGAASRAISVANSTDGSAAPVLQITAPLPLAASYPVGSASFGPPVNGESGEVVLVEDALAPTSDGCETPFANAGSLVGKIALIDRGVCAFAVKTANAQASGAIGVIIANNVAGDPPGLGGADPTITIPTLSITQALGTSIKTELAGGGTVEVVFASGGDTVNAGSSRGPRNAIPLRLKPDVAAPGTNIPSVQAGRVCDGSTITGCIVPDATGYIAGNQVLTISGTSMAAPHVAGVMALLREQRPDWTVSDLKALLMNYSLHDLFQWPLAAGGGAQYGPGRVGAGRTDVPMSAKGEVIAYDADDPGLVSVSFDGEFAVNGPTVREKTVRVVNRGGTERTFDVGIATTVDAPGVALGVSSASVTVPAGGSATLTVQLTADPSAMDQSRDQTVAATLLGASRFSIAEEGGYLTLSSGGELSLRVPLYAFVRPVSDMKASSPVILTGGAATGTGAITLDGEGLCTGTAGAGTCALGTATDRVSVVTPLELQGTSPRSSDLIGTFADAADIQHVGVAYDAAEGLLLFGVSSWSEWAQPPSFNISVDTNSDGTWDKLVMNYPHAVNGIRSDLHAIWVGDHGSTSGSVYLTTNVAGAGFDSNLYGSNVVVLAVPVSALAFPSGVTSFRYRVDGCAAASTCGVSPDTALDSVPSDPTGYLTWDFANPGLGFGGAWLMDDLPAATLPLSWDTGRMAATGSLGALLLHHWNGGPFGGTSARAEALTLEGSGVVAGDLGVSVAVDPVSPVRGGAVAITLTAQNLGGDSVAGVTVAHAIPAGLGFLSTTGTYDPLAGLWTIPALAAGTSATTTINALVGHGGSTELAPMAIPVEAYVSAPGLVDSNLSNNSARVVLQVAEADATPPGSFFGVTPCRVLDTRNEPEGTYSGPPLASGVERIVPLFGRCGVPMTAKAVAANLTVVGSQGMGHLVTYPGGTTPPSSSTINFSAGQTRANNAVIAVSAAGTLAVRATITSGTVHLVMDVVGYFE